MRNTPYGHGNEQASQQASTGSREEAGHDAQDPT